MFYDSISLILSGFFPSNIQSLPWLASESDLVLTCTVKITNCENEMLASKQGVRLSTSAELTGYGSIISIHQGLTGGMEAHWNHLDGKQHSRSMGFPKFGRDAEMPCSLLLSSIFHVAPGFPFVADSLSLPHSHLLHLFIPDFCSIRKW